MNIADTLIIVAGLLWAIETIPQIIKLVNTKETAGISLPFFYICIVAYIMFLTGNTMLRNWPVVISSTLPFINVSIIVYLVRKYRNFNYINRTTIRHWKEKQNKNNENN